MLTYLLKQINHLLIIILQYITKCIQTYIEELVRCAAFPACIRHVTRGPCERRALGI